MTTPDHINDGWTVDDLIDDLEGEDFLPEDPEKNHFLCDFCSKGVNYSSNPRVGGYVADGVLNEGHPVWQRASRGNNSPIVPLAAYCEDCAQRLLLFPCRGYGEARTFFDVTEEQAMENVEVTDVSPRDKGIPWDPKELSSRISEVPFEQNMIADYLRDGGHLWGPENMVTFFIGSVRGIDIREIVRGDGSIDPKALGRARKEFNEFYEEMRAERMERTAFRDYVRENDE